MGSRDPSFDDYVLKIYEVLDRLDYYRLLGVNREASNPEIKKAFFSIAAKFHPDRNRDADETVGEAIYTIYKRLNEAYGVLCDHEKKRAYDETLRDGRVRLELEDRRTAVPKMPEETISNREARQFFVQAREALKRGDVMQAELHIKVAKSREGDNAAIESMLAQIQVAKIEKKKKKKKPGKS